MTTPDTTVIETALSPGDLVTVTGGNDRPQPTAKQLEEIRRKLGDDKHTVAHELTHVVQQRR
jgi:hypothetical protein